MSLCQPKNYIIEMYGDVKRECNRAMLIVTGLCMCFLSTTQLPQSYIVIVVSPRNFELMWYRLFSQSEYDICQ